MVQKVGLVNTDSTCGTSKGDLVKKVDQVGNTTCLTYDALHRLTSVTYPSGSYASVTSSKFLVYDAATVNSIAMVNAKARMAEAYTCFSPCSTKITDLGFSYTVRGESSDVYESTPHSGGYYHVTAAYWPNGALNQLSNLTGLPTITYNVDGEGRLYSASAASGQNPLTSTTYNPASEPTAVDFGSSDGDSFTYDPNSDRMTQYKFNVNSQSVTGNLTWNPNRSLESLVITDPFNSADAQTCNYTHDDLSRIASANCGTAASQTFTYDAFGNINKSGSPYSFQPTYASATNHMTLIGTSTPTYDSNGNVTNDFLHAYAWDSNGRPVTIDTVGVTYDALGRMVEQNRSSIYTEIVYSPMGTKLALMNGTTLQRAFVPLTGGTEAVYNSSGLVYYRHSDWLGSSRFASTPTRAMYYDGAYAPFGEPYAQSGTTDVSFTGMNQDVVSNLYDFPAREYGIQGRWPSPDPAGLMSAHLRDPQTLNRYAYVRNNPLSLTDSTGLDPTGKSESDDDCEGDDDSNCGIDDGSDDNTCLPPTCASQTVCSDTGCDNATTVIVDGGDNSAECDALCGVYTQRALDIYEEQTWVQEGAYSPFPGLTRAAELAGRSLPTPCGGGIFEAESLGAGGTNVGMIEEQDSVSGKSSGPFAEQNFGVAGGGAFSTGGNATYMLFAETAPDTGPVVFATPAQGSAGVGWFVENPAAGFSAGAYVNITSAYSCSGG